MREGRSLGLSQILYRAFYVILLSGICFTGFGRQLGIYESNVRALLFTAVFLGGLLGISYCRIKGKIACGCFLLVLLWLIPVVSGAEQAGGFWQSYGDWLFGASGWRAEWLAGYGLVQCCLIAAGCYLFQIVSEKFPLCKDISAVLLFGNLLFCMFQKKSWEHTAVVLVLWYVMLCFVEGTERYWKKRKGEEKKTYLLYLLPFCVFYVLLLFLTPAPEKPYDWKLVKDAYANIRELVTVWVQNVGRSGEEDFALAQKGFSENGRLMGGLFDNDRILLTVKGTPGLKTNVYLTGKIYDTFDGKQWTQTIQGAGAGEIAEDYLMDTLETLYAVRQYGAGEQADYVYSTGLDVRYEYFHTGCVFAPLKLQKLENCDYQSSGSNLIFGEKKGYGTKYRAVYFQLNVDHPAFYEMASASLPEDAAVWAEVVEEYASGNKEKLTLEALHRYQMRTVENYSRTLALSEDVSDYLAEVTQGAQTDVQKLLAIEKALSGMTYTEAPGQLPEGIANEGDFLDYFLLESQQGYCAYFATAFVLLARAEGIPARYVEGFCVPVTEDKRMTVTSGMAHAWAEAYLEGIGWIPFEPTPGYAQIRYTPWKIKSEKNILYSGEEESLEEELLQEEKEDAADVPDSVLEEEAGLSEGMDKKVQRVLWGMAAAVVVGALLLWLLDLLLARRSYRRMTPEKQFETEVKRSLWLLSGLGFSRRDEETLTELQQRASEGMEGQEMPLHFLTSYEEYRYGKQEITEEILQAAGAERKQLLLYVKQRKGWLYYAYCLLRSR